MSRSPRDDKPAADETASYREHFKAFASMLTLGRSLSGNERNCCFLNMQGDSFADISSVAGLDFPQDGRGVALTDWDFDGDLDVWLLNRNRPRVQLLRNEVGSQQHFVTFRLQGRTCNRDAIGARLELHLKNPSRKLSKTLHAGHGFATQSSKWVHFGLGEQTEIEKVVVRWPGGDAETIEGVAADRFWTLTQGEAKAAPFSPGPAPPRLVAANKRMSSAAKFDRMRIGMAGTVPTPTLRYRTWEGDLQSLDFPRRRPVFVNLWANWCAPCLKELKEIATAKTQFEQYNLDVIALTMDGVNDLDAEGVAKSRAFLKERIAFPFDSGLATLDLAEKLRLLHTPMLDGADTAALPTSFLIRGDGQLAAIYQGPVDIPRLLADVDRVHQSDGEPTNLAIEFPGRWRTFPSQRDQLITLAALFATSKYEEDSLAYSSLAMKIDPESELAKRNFDTATSRLADMRARIDQFTQQIQLQPENADAHFNLGMAHQRVGELELAVVDFQNAIARDENLTDAYVQLGVLFARLGDLRQAEASLQTALNQNPAHQFAKQVLDQVKATKEKRE